MYVDMYIYIYINIYSTLRHSMCIHTEIHKLVYRCAYAYIRIYVCVCVSVCVYLRPQTARLRYIPQWSDRWGTQVRSYRKCPGGTCAVPSASTEPHSGLSPPPAPNFNVEHVCNMRLRTFVRKKPAQHCRQMFRFNIEIGGRGGMAHTMRKEVPLQGVANFRLPSVAPGPLKGGGERWGQTAR